jgi:putative flippase GtrA
MRALALTQAPQAPEIVDFYTARDRRGRGCGAALLAQCEQFLRRRGERYYWVKTEDSVDNRALDFYCRHGLSALGTIIDLETRFVVLAKSLNGVDPRALASADSKPERKWFDTAEIFRFILAGGSNTLFTLAIFEAMLFFVPYGIAYAVSWICGLVFAAAVYPSHVFSEQRPSIGARVTLGVILVLTYLVGLLLLGVLQQAGIDPRIGVFIALPLTAFLGYASLRINFRLWKSWVLGD